MPTDPRRHIPRTDVLLAEPEFAHAVRTLGRDAVKAAIARAQAQAREGLISPAEVASVALEIIAAPSTTLTPIINATGVIIHTNIGRAPLSEAAADALVTASGYVDVEFDRDSGQRGKRGRGTIAALLDKVPAAEGALIVNNGAAALLLTCLAVAGTTKDVLISRGELIEIGDGFRLPELLQSAGIRLIEVGMTNRTHLRDYAQALTENTGAILKVHTSNYRVEGFAGVPDVAELATVGVPVIADVGSGLLTPNAALPDEPDVTTWLEAGAALVTASGDKLLGGPQAGLVLGEAQLVERVRRHPIARAMRADKLTLAAMEATLRGPQPPVLSALSLTPDALRARTETLAARVGGTVVETDGRVGGGAAPGVSLPSLAVALPESFADRLRRGTPSVLTRATKGRCLIDLRCVPTESDEIVAAAIEAIHQQEKG